VSQAVKLSEAFRQLCAVVRPRADMAANMEAAAARLYIVLSEYPEAVALKALDQWPRKSEWFPTEFELRGLCEEIANDNAREEAQASEAYVGGGRYNRPDGMVFQFVERVRGMRGDGYCKSWLAGGITCQFGHNRIYTTGLGERKLHEDFGDLARELGVAIIAEKAMSEMLARYCDERGLEFKPRGGRK